MSRAYNQCWKEVALVKLHRLGITGRTLWYVQSFLEVSASVRIGNKESQIYIQENGIPQGAVISLTIFSIMVNDLGKEITTKQSG